MVKGFAFIGYSVKDMATAVAFYRDVLGLRDSQVASDAWTEFDVGDSTFGIGNGEELGMLPGKSSGAAFEVDDVVGDIARLRELGVEVVGPMPAPNCTFGFVTDPDGNTFALHQRK